MNLREPARWILAVVVVCSAGIVSHAQDQLGPENLEPKTLPANPPRVAMRDDARMQTILYEVEQYAGDRLPFELLGVLPEGATLRDVMPEQFATVQSELSRREIRLRDDGRVNVEIIGPEGAPAIDEQLIDDFGGVLNGVWRHRRDVWIPIHRLTELAQQLPDGYFMERAGPNTHDSHGEGPDVINSAGYIDGGADGTGMTIAIIDSGYTGFTASQQAGHAPPAAQTTQVNFTGTPFEDTTTHGTGVVESVFAHAPGANYRLYRIGSITHFGMAVNDAIINQTDIIAHSMSRYNQGWQDNSGDACDIANTAGDAGLLFFTSAGNRARQHWQGVMNPSSGGWHRFSGSDETIEITLPNGAGGSFYLQWDLSGVFNYDLYLYDSDLSTILASSTIAFPNVYEQFSYTNNTGSTQVVHLAVHNVSGGNTEFEVFFHSTGCNICTACDFQHAVSASSITSPSNSTHPNVISNAAVDWSDHDSSGGASGIAMCYSSRGPSNDGATRPDLAGPTNTATNCCGGAFGGTSAATPNNAGAAAVFWSTQPQFNAMAIRWLLREQAALWKDWGQSGKDNVYGHGGCILIDYAEDRVWLARDYGNNGNQSNGPYFTTQAAFNNALNNGRVTIFPGGLYPESFTSSGSKSVTFETVENTATLGSQ